MQILAKWAEISHVKILLQVICCMPAKPHERGTPVAHQVYAKVEGWRTLKVQRSKKPCIMICILFRQYAKEYSLGYIHSATPTEQ